MELETRICPTCKKPFKVSANSKQMYDSIGCVEFKSGKIKYLSWAEMVDAKRNGFKKSIKDQVK